MSGVLDRTIDAAKLALLAARQHLGRRFWLVPLGVLIWPVALALLSVANLNPVSFDASNAQNWLIGIPLNALAIGIGIGIIADEIERRTLEVTYTVPGGTRSIWLAKLAAAIVLILWAELLLLVATVVFFAAIPPSVFFRALQSAIFFVVLAMGAGVMLRNKLSAALVTGGLFALMLSVGFDNRWSPLFNPLAERYAQAAQVTTWSVQNHVGIALVIIGIASLSFARAERRELLLAD